MKYIFQIPKDEDPATTCDPDSCSPWHLTPGKSRFD